MCRGRQMRLVFAAEEVEEVKPRPSPLPRRIPRRSGNQRRGREDTGLRPAGGIQGSRDWRTSPSARKVASDCFHRRQRWPETIWRARVEGRMEDGGCGRRLGAAAEAPECRLLLAAAGSLFPSGAREGKSSRSHHWGVEMPWRFRIQKLLLEVEGGQSAA